MPSTKLMLRTLRSNDLSSLDLEGALANTETPQPPGLVRIVSGSSPLGQSPRNVRGRKVGGEEKQLTHFSDAMDTSGESPAVVRPVTPSPMGEVVSSMDLGDPSTWARQYIELRQLSSQSSPLKRKRDDNDSDDGWENSGGDNVDPGVEDLEAEFNGLTF